MITSVAVSGFTGVIRPALIPLSRLNMLNTAVGHPGGVR
jgi:hypothetical protein